MSWTTLIYILENEGEDPGYAIETWYSCTYIWSYPVVQGGAIPCFPQTSVTIQKWPASLSENQPGRLYLDGKEIYSVLNYQQAADLLRQNAQNCKTNCFVCKTVPPAPCPVLLSLPARAARASRLALELALVWES